MILTFIIPLYNCKAYIGKCLDEIYLSNIPLKEFEVIVVNDGSTDSGPEIVEDHCTRFSNLHLINQINQGASTARNLGIDNSKGDYIWFVDADDFIEKNFLKQAIGILVRKDYDMLSFNFNKLNANGSIERVEGISEICEKTGVEAYENFPIGFLWNNIYKRSAIGAKRFIYGTKNIEDLYFNSSVVLEMKRILFYPEIGYNYNNMNLSSTSRNRDKKNMMKLSLDSMIAHQKMKDDIDKSKDILVREARKNLLNYSIAGHFYSLIRYYTPEQFYEVICSYKLMNVYPIGSTTYGRRTQRFINIANHEFVIKIIMNVCYFIRKIKKLFKI